MGMHVPLPADFTPNGRETPSPLRATYATVSPAVNKMLRDIVEQRLAFLLPYEDAVRYVLNLHLRKAHWKASGRPLGDLAYVDGTPINTTAMSDSSLWSHQSSHHRRHCYDDLRLLGEGHCPGPYSRLDPTPNLADGFEGRLHPSLLQARGCWPLRHDANRQHGLSSDRRHLRLGRYTSRVPVRNSSHQVGVSALLVQRDDNVRQ